MGMENLYIKGSEETPEIVFNKDKPEFRVSGKSYMEDATAHYEQVISWITEYGKNPNPSTISKFELEYVNTASSKIVNDILDELEAFLWPNSRQYLTYYWHILSTFRIRSTIFHSL